MADHPEDNDPFEEDIVFDEAGLLGGKMPRARRQATAGFLPTFMLFIRTVFLCIAFLGLGLCVSVSGGPLIKMEITVGVPESTAFHVFTARSVGMLLGGALGSVLFEVYNRQFLLSVSLVWVAAAVTVLPFTVPAALWWTLASTAALGTGLAFLFTGGNVLCLDLWGRRQGGAALQALHFSFSLGALVVPLVVQPFFADLPHVQTTTAVATTTPLTTEVAVAIRHERSATHGMEPHSPTNMSEKDLRCLTHPEGICPNTTTESTTNHTTTTTMPPTPSTPKIPRKKPAVTNDKNLDPDDNMTKWTKPPPRKNPPPPPPPPRSPPTTQKAPTTTQSPKPTDAHSASANGTASQSTAAVTATSANTGQSGTVNNTTTTTTKGLPLSASHTSSVPTTATTTTPATTTTTTTAAPTTITTTSTSVATTTTTTPTTTTTTTTHPTTTTTTTTTTKAPPPITSRPTTTTTTTVKPKPTTTTPSTTTTTPTTTTTTTSPHTTTTTTTPSTTTMHDLPPAVNRGDVGGGEVRQLTSEVQPYEVQKLREMLPEEESSAGTPSPKPDTYSNASDDKNNSLLEHMAQSLDDYGVTRFHLAYISIGILVVVDALVSVVVLCHHPREARSRQEGGPMATARPSRALLFTVLFSAFMFAAEALQGALHHLLASTESGSGLPILWGGGEEGPNGQVVFWGLVCLVRFLCILAAGCVGPPGRLLGAAVVFSVAGASFMVVGASGKQDFVWAGVVFLAVGCAPVLPTSLLWMAQHMRVTHRLCALMVVVASFGNTLTHSLLAEVMGHPPTHAFVLLGLAMASVVLLSASVCALHAGQNNPNLGAPVGYQLASQHEEDSLELTPSASVVFTPADAASHEGGEAGQALLID